MVREKCVPVCEGLQSASNQFLRGTGKRQERDTGLIVE